MQKFPPQGAVVALLFSAALIHTGAAQNIGTALTTGAPQINSGTVDGNVQQMTGANATLNSGAVITGDLLVPGTPALIQNGTPNFGGTIVGTGSASPSNYQVILNGSVRLGHLRTRTNPVTIPALPPVPTPSGTRTVTITAAGQSAGSFSTLKNLTLNGNVGQYVIPAGTYGDFIANGGSGFTLGVTGANQPAVYNFQHLTLNGQTSVVVLGPVVINVANGFTANGAAGTSTNPAWLKLNIVAGGFTLNSGCAIYGYVAAPNGTVIINGATKLIGGSVSTGLTVNANGLLQLFDVQSFENHPPVAANQATTTAQDTAKSIILSATDVDGQTLTYSVVSQPSHGLLSGTPPQLTYTPTHGYYGSDSFTFKANDGQADSNVATVSITVTHVNHAPVANAQTLTLNQGASIPVTLAGSDVDNDALTFRVTTTPAHGALSGAPPNLTYTPAQTFYGTDSFSFVANDGALDSAPATVLITVNHVNQPPVAAGQSVQTNEDTATTILLSATDVDADPLTFVVLTSPAHGTLSGAAPNLTYTPVAHFFGSDTFTFRASDGIANSAPATVQITVVHVNHPPTADGQNVSLDEDTTLAILLTGSDPDGDSISFSIVSQPQHGTLSGAPPNVVYTPAPDYFGEDAFAFRTNDGSANSGDGVVNITVRPVNDPPTVQISAPSSGAQFDAGDTVHIVATASDIDGTIATFRLLLDGVVVFESLQTSVANFDLLDVAARDYSISALVIDNEGASAASAQVPITVHSQGNGPVQVNAGPDRLISLPGTAHLEGSVTVNGAPAGNEVQLAWQRNSGSGNATFDNSAALQPTVTFDAPGDYVLKLAATAPEGTGFDTVKVTVLAAPQAGPDSPVSNYGREFWMTFLSQSAAGLETDHEGDFLIISSEVASSGRVEISETDQVNGNWQTSRWVERFVVEAGQKTLVQVAPSAHRYVNQYDQALPTAIHVVADAPVAVHALSTQDFSTDGSLIFPNGLLGRDYFVMSYSNASFSGAPSAARGTEFAVVATKPQTQVTITPTAATAAHPAGQPFTVTLQTGDVFRMQSNTSAGDFTGTRVQADKPVAVFGGHTAANVPVSVSYSDHLYEQIPSVDSWGRHFVTLPLKARNGGDVFRMLAANDHTRVSINGEIVATLNRGQFYETVLAQPASIISDQRILLAQFARSSEADHTTGDPFMALVPPSETFGRHYILGTQKLYSYYSGTEVDPFDSYLSLVVDSAYRSEVTINGQPIPASEFVPIGESGFSGASIPVPKDSTFRISAPTPIGAWIYGWAPYESYGFNGGMYGAIDSGSASFQLTQTAQAAPVGSLHHVRAALLNSFGLPLQDARVDFSIAGVNPITGSGLTAADGTVEFSWQGLQTGADTVTATTGVFTATASVTWVFGEANQPPQVNAGPDVLVRFGEPLALHGIVQDDGLPAGGQLTLQWSTLPGPGDVTFADPASGDTTASFLYPGQYRLRFTAYDGQFAGEDDLLVTVDIPPAFIELDFSAAVDAGKEWRVGVSAEDQDGLIARIDLIEGNAILATLEPNEQRVFFSYTVLSTVFTLAGPHSLTVRLSDDQGLTTDRVVDINVRPVPVVHILSPPDGASIPAGESFTFTASASSPGGSITRVVYSDATGYEFELGEGVGPDYQFIWTPDYTGTISITATAYDSEGASGTSPPITLTVESPGDPTVAIMSPADGSAVYLGQSLTIRAEALAVAPAQLSGVSFFDNNRYLAFQSSPPFELQWTPATLGSHNLTVYASDTFGGFASASISLNVVNVPELNISLVHPPPNIPIIVNTPIALAATIDNIIGTFDDVWFYVNNEFIGNGASVLWTPPAVGDYEIEIYADSYAPYQFGQLVVQLQVVAAPPLSVTLVQPPLNIPVKVNTPITLGAAVGNVLGTLDGVAFRVNGEPVGDGFSPSVTWTPGAVGLYQIEVIAHASNPNQEGSVVVNITVADLHSPLVQWGAPPGGASFPPNTPIVLQAQATDIDSNLVSLQFQADGQLLFEIPLSGGAGVGSFTWENAGPGWHALTALALDDTLQSGAAFLRVFVERFVANDLLPPSGLTSEAISSSVIHLAWIPSASANATGSVIERRAGNGGVWEEIATVDATTATYDDTSLESERHYSYRLASLNEAGARSIYSNESSATTAVQIPQYAVIDLGENLDQSFVALNLIEQRFLYARVGGMFPSAAVLELKDAEVMSIDEGNNVLLKKRDTTSNGQITIEYYFVWHVDGRTPDYVGDPSFRAFRLSRGGVVAGAVDHSTSSQPGVADAIYTGFEFWLRVGSYPGTMNETRIDVRAATWTPAGGVHEVTPDDEHQYRYDRLDINPARMLPRPFDSLYSAWDVSDDGTVAGTGSWSDLRYVAPDFPLESLDEYRPLTFQHGMRWKNGQWDTLGSLRRDSETEGESIAVAINPLGTVAAGGSRAPDRADDPPLATHAMRSRMPFLLHPLEPGDVALENLMPLGNGSYSWAWDVDAAGDAVGYSTKHQSDPISRTHAAYWDFTSNAAVELPDLGGRFPPQYPEGYGYANAINAAGDRIVGKSLTTDLFTAGTLWTLNANHGGGGRWWEAHNLNEHVPSDWQLVNAIDLNANGSIVGIAYHTVPDPTNPSGPPLPVRRSVVLLPIEIRDVSNSQTVTDVAWIKGHRTDGSGEHAEMPKIEARIIGLPTSRQVEWRLENRYPRRSGRDDLNIPDGGGTEPGIFIPGDEPWRIWEVIANSSTKFFGGDVTVKFTIQSNSGGPADRGAISFKIRGENPDDFRCKTHIISNQGSVWYAWAIAKHESADSTSFYNQFANGLANGGAGVHGARGEPFYAPSEGDGWGLFQRDSASGHPVTTEETWSWDGNMRGFLQDEYPGHLRIANNYVDSVKRNNPSRFEEPQFTIKGRAISGRDVLALTWYNGPQGRSNSRMLHFDGSRPSGQRWSLDLPNAPGKNQPYVHEIMDQYNGG